MSTRKWRRPVRDVAAVVVGVAAFAALGAWGFGGHAGTAHEATPPLTAFGLPTATASPGRWTTALPSATAATAAATRAPGPAARAATAFPNVAITAPATALASLRASFVARPSKGPARTRPIASKSITPVSTVAPKKTVTVPVRTADGTTVSTTVPYTGACSLLTIAEVSAALGTPATAQQTQEPGPVGGSLCTWAASDGATTGVTFLVQQPPDITQPGMTPTSFFDEEIQGARTDGPLVTLTGVADEAYLSTTADTLSSTQLYGLKGQTAFTGYIPLAASVSTDALKSLGALIGSRL